MLWHTNFMQPKILTTKTSAGYSLQDSGEGEKLERFGVFTLARPDPQALWLKNNPIEIWQKAQGVFHINEKTKKSAWIIKEGVPAKWQVEIGGLQFAIKPSSFKHVGVFPEQVPNWDWIREALKSAKSHDGGKVSVLNLFGYTGGATLAAAQSGAEVCHVDSSKTAITWARENAGINNLSDKPIRWILDDAMTFVTREIKRGNKYDAIIMDPPAFGRGPSGEVWKIEDDFLKLIDLCKQVMSPKPIFFLMSGYASGYSAIAYGNILKNLTKDWAGEIETGELTIEEEKTGRLLPAGIFGRWHSK